MKVNTEIDGLKKANEGNAELTKQIEEMKAQADEREKAYKAELHKMQVDSIVDDESWTLVSPVVSNNKVELFV